MQDNISLNIPKDGAMPYVEGSYAAAAAVATRTDEDGNLQVMLTLSPVGDDALHGGSLTGEFTLVKPEYVANSDKSADEQSTIGAEYARIMIEATQTIVGGHLGEFMGEAARNAVTPDDDEGKVEHISNMCMMIAALLIVQAKGDRELAKVNADIANNPQLADLARKAGVTPNMVGLLRDTVRLAIDVCEVGEA